MIEPARKAPKGRESLLDAALELLPGALRAGLGHSLGPVPLSRQAGVSRQTWYRYWGTEGEPFIEDLVRHLLPVSRGIAGAMSDGTTGLVPGDDPTGVEVARELAELSFYVSVDPEYVLSRFVVFSLATEERILADSEGRDVEGGVTALVRDYYDRFTDELADAYQVLLDAWGREPAPPFDLRGVAVVLTALAAGLSFRHVVDPENAPESLGRDAILLIGPALTRVKVGSTGRGPVELFGGGPDEPGEAHSVQRLAGKRRVEQSRSAIVAAARRAFTLRGYTDVSISEIASVADVSATTIYEHFWSKSGLARVCFEPEYRALAGAVEKDLTDPITRIRNHIGRLALTLRELPALAAAVLDTLAQGDDTGMAIDPRDPRLASPLPMALLAPIREAKAEGMIGAELRSVDIAVAITNLVLVHGRFNPDLSADRVASHVEQVILRGVLTGEGREAVPALGD